MFKDVSRREFLTLAGTAAVTPAWLETRSSAPRQAATVHDVMARVQQSCPAARRRNTCGWAEGRPGRSRVTGIATAPIAQRRRHPPRRRRRLQSHRQLRADVLRARRRLVAGQSGERSDVCGQTRADRRPDVAVWRLRDQWLAQRPAAFINGLVEKLALEDGTSQPDARSRGPARRRRSAISSRTCRRRLGARAMRVVGAPDLARAAGSSSRPGPSAPAMTFRTWPPRTSSSPANRANGKALSTCRTRSPPARTKAMVLVGRLL